MVTIKQTVILHKKRVYLLAGLALLFSSALIIQAFMMTHIIDGVFLQNQTVSDIFPWLIILFVILTVRFGTDYGSKRIGVLIACERYVKTC